MAAAATTPTSRVRVAVLTVSLATSLLVAEGVARLVAYLEPTARVAIYRASGLPQVGYTMIPNLDAHVLGSDLRTNALGFRGPDWSRRKAPGTTRIVLIGDSHAFGFGVDVASSMGEVLARELTIALGHPVEVLNFAVSGYNAKQELAVLRRLALAYAPDVVLLVPCNNDDDPPLLLTRSGHLVASPEDVDRPPPLRVPWRQSALLAAARRALERVRRGAAHDGPVAASQAVNGPLLESVHVPRALEARVARPLHRMITLSRAHGADVVLAPLAGPQAWRQMLHDVARRERVPLVELLELLPEGRTWNEILDRFGLGWDPHLGPVAHARWGRALAALMAARLASPGAQAARTSLPP